MKLKKLLKNLPQITVKGSKEIEITGISSYSKQITPGNLFIARKGKTDNGNRYIGEAVSSGANAVLTDIYDPFLKDTVQLIHPNPGSLESLLVAEFYQYPSKELFMVGITGTNGKTTTSFIIKSLLEQLMGPCGLIGTVEYIVGRHRYEATRTTPDVTLNQKMLKEMVRQGCKAAVMEVTSHALDQGRVDKIDFDVAVFTNLSQDHLDYHHNMEEYCKAKGKLFKSLGQKNGGEKKESIAVVNADSPWLNQIIEGCQTKIITYAIDNEADLKATNIEFGSLETKATLIYRGEKVVCSWPLIGRFNVYNALAAIGVGLAKNFPLQKIVETFATLQPIRGRLERVRNEIGYQIFVDFAHSEDALANVLQTLKELKQKRIITVFGCGGERDAAKRPKMAEASEKFSDLSIITSDNPRSESPETIIQAIIRGFKDSNAYIVELDRREAIKKAIDLASLDDIILIAGKGHESYQVFAHQTIKFDDSQVARELCAAKK